MGAITSRQHAGVEEVDIMSNHAYKYPPRSGNYFGSHFIMGGERFDTPQPESYLFGENTDLNFLGSRPTPFPYPPPQPNEPTKTLKCLVNIRKESLRFIRAPIDYSKPKLDNNDGDVELGKNTSFNIEFTFDCDVRCAITIYYFAIEEYSTTAVGFSSRDSKLTSETYHYKRGANQQFCQMSHIFDPSKYTEDELLYDIDREVMPIAIHCVAEDGPDELRQSHTTIAAVDKTADGTYILKALKQKLFVDGLCYLLQEIYGIENKHTSEKQHRSHQTTAQNIADVATDVSNSPSGDTNDDHNSPPTAPPPTSSATPSPTPSRTPSSTEDGEDNGSECVICMCDVRDTLILPCRHLCLCNSCADSLRYQANNCPICRAPFRALLQVRALQKIGGGGGGGENRGSNATNAVGSIATAIGATGGVGNGSGTGSPPDPTCDNIPPGYQAVSLIEALNGPCSPRSTHITTPAQAVSVNTQAALVVQAAQHVTNMPDLVDTPDHDIVALHAAQLLNRPDHRNAKAGKNGYGGGAGGRQGLTADSPEFGMSVLVLRDEDNKETPKCPLLSESTITPRSKQNMKPRDTVRHINENAEKTEGPDEVDSEAEKSSPLLETAMMRNCLGGLTLNMADVEPIDDHDDDNDDYPRATSKLEKPKGYGRSGEERGDESDHFYTPEDPTAPLPAHTPSDTPSNNHQPDSGDSSVDGTPLHHASHQQLRGAGGLGTGASLLTPGTPASQVSTRSVDSRDSYSSSSGAGSTKHLLMDRGDRMVGERLSGGGDRNREVRL